MVTRSLCFCFRTRFVHLFRDTTRFRSNRESKLMFYLLKVTTKILFSYEYDCADGWKQQKPKQKREMKWFISRHLPYNIPWNVKALSIHFTVIEATTLRSKLFRDESRGGICCYLLHVFYTSRFFFCCWLLVHWSILQALMCGGGWMLGH